jgi:hypothetical protein
MGKRLHGVGEEVAGGVGVAGVVEAVARIVGENKRLRSRPRTTPRLVKRENVLWNLTGHQIQG